MSAHRRAWKHRAGVIAALVASALLALPAVPAQADDPEVQITGLSKGSLNTGETATLTFTVRNKNDAPTTFGIEVDTFIELSCSGDCNIPARQIGRDEVVTFTATLTGGNVAAGQTKSGTVRVSANSGGDRASDERNVTVRGPNAAPTQPAVQTVREISGKVVDAKGDPVAGAIVGLLDSRQQPKSVTTNNAGTFRFTGSTSAPIAPGAIEIGASKDGERVVKTINADAGQSLTNQRLALNLRAEPTASPTPEATPETTEESTEPTPEATGEDAEAAPANTSNEDSGGFGSWLLIIVGGLFVAVGVGTIVLLWMRRKEQGDGTDPAGAAGAVAPTRGGGGSRGMDDQTRIVNRPVPGADPTMVGGQSLADAPTMMHNRPLVDDEFPDKYGAPLPSQQPTGPNYGQAADSWATGGYGGSGSRYDDPAPTQAGYGYGYAPASGGGYGSRDYDGSAGGGYQGAQSGGYGERYDEPTGRYSGATEQYVPPTDPYATGAYPSGDSRRGYGQEQSYGQEQTGGYGQEQSYGRSQEQTGGYSQGGGYGAPAPGGYDSGQGYDSGGYGQRDYGSASGRGYERGAGGGYDQPGHGGYDQSGNGGYDQRSGHDRTPEQRSGYDNRYEQGGYYGAPPQGDPDQQTPRDRSGRRSLDWMDD